MAGLRKESDSLGVVEVPADKLWGAQTQRSREHFSIGKDLLPREMILHTIPTDAVALRLRRSSGSFLSPS
jgi:fumarate hydratase, class II